MSYLWRTFNPLLPLSRARQRTVWTVPPGATASRPPVGRSRDRGPALHADPRAPRKGEGGGERAQGKGRTQREGRAEARSQGDEGGQGGFRDQGEQGGGRIGRIRGPSTATDPDRPPRPEAEEERPALRGGQEAHPELLELAHPGRLVRPLSPFIAAGKGARIWDEDGNEYLDFNLAYGVLINGHAPREQVKAIQERAELGLHFAAPTALEIEVAKLFQKMVPTASKVAFCSNGSDATMNAIRIARAVTGKDAILKFEGHYHGQHDYALISSEAPPSVAGLDEYPRPILNSAGIPPGVTDYVMVAQYNSVVSFERMVRRYRDRLAAVILEPIMANSGIIRPNPITSSGSSKSPTRTTSSSSLTRCSRASAWRRAAPRSSTGSSRISPAGPRRWAAGSRSPRCRARPSTWNSSPPGGSRSAAPTSRTTFRWPARSRTFGCSTRAGRTSTPRFARMTARLEKGLEEAAHDTKVNVLVQSVNGMLQFFFTRRKKIQNYRESLQIDWNLYLRHHQLLLDKGIYIHPDNYERLTFSSAHTDKDIEKFISIAHETFAELKTLPRDYLP